MIRYAIISDIHGNLEALKAIKEDIKNQNVDRVICLGDIVSKGSHGHECLEIVREIADAVVKGNNDITYSMSLDEIAEICADFDYSLFMWTQRQLTTEDIDYLRKLPMCCELVLSGRLVRCFHAKPDDTEGTVFDFSTYKEKLSLFEPTEYTTSKTADVVVFGHTHHLSIQKMFGKTLINAGSVGNSLNVFIDNKYNSSKIEDFTMAEYIILSGENSEEFADFGIEVRNVPYNKEKELEDFSNEEDKTLYENEIRFGKYRFPERLEQHFKCLRIEF